MGKIHIIDVTNRDGVQTAKLGLSKLEKTMLNLYLNDMGVFQSEFGFPTTRHERNYLQANLELAKRGSLQPMRLAGWLRAVPGDVELAFKLVPGLKHINLSISTSDQMIQGKFLGKKTREDVLNMMVEAVRPPSPMTPRPSASMPRMLPGRTWTSSSGSAGPPTEHGAARLRYCDTLGYDNPFTIYDAVKTLARKHRTGDRDPLPRRPGDGGSQLHRRRKGGH